MEPNKGYQYTGPICHCGSPDYESLLRERNELLAREKRWYELSLLQHGDVARELEETRAELQRHKKMDWANTERECQEILRLRAENKYLSEELTRLKLKIEAAQEDVLFYRREWESRCESLNYSLEIQKDLEAKLQKAEESLKQLKGIQNDAR